jgi:hypothetical protein
MMTSITKFTIHLPDDNGNYKKYYELFDTKKQFIIRLDQYNKIQKIFPVDKKYFDNYKFDSSYVITIKNFLIEKAYKTMCVELEHQKHFKILQDITKDEMFKSKEYFLSNGIEKYKQNKIDEAINIFKLAQEYDNDSSVYLWLSRCYIKKKILEDAIDNIERAYYKGFYYYSDIIEDTDFEPILTNTRIIKILQKMFMKKPGKNMSIKTLKLLHKYGIFTFDEDDEESSKKRSKIDDDKSKGQLLIQDVKPNNQYTHNGYQYDYYDQVQFTQKLQPAEEAINLIKSAIGYVPYGSKSINL